MEFKNQIYELLAAGHSIEEIVAAFTETLNETSAELAATEEKTRRMSSPWLYKPSELPELMEKLSTDTATIEDGVVLLFSIMCQEHPEMKEYIEAKDVGAFAAGVVETINITNKLRQSLLNGATKVGVSSKPSIKTLEDFLKTL